MSPSAYHLKIQIKPVLSWDQIVKDFIQQKAMPVHTKLFWKGSFKMFVQINIGDIWVVNFLRLKFLIKKLPK